MRVTLGAQRVGGARGEAVGAQSPMCALPGWHRTCQGVQQRGAGGQCCLFYLQGALGVGVSGTKQGSQWAEQTEGKQTGWTAV